MMMSGFDYNVVTKFSFRRKEDKLRFGLFRFAGKIQLLDGRMQINLAWARHKYLCNVAV